MTDDLALPLSGLSDVRALKGQSPRNSPWLRIDQTMIDRFATATHDHQWIHVDPIRAATESPYGATIAHGFLSLSLLSHLFTSCFSFPNRKMGVNYGFDRIRFISPVKAGAEIRAKVALADYTDIGPQDIRVSWDVAVEIAGYDKPALTALWLVQMRY